MQDTDYRIIKFSNGDTLIAKILEIRKNTLVIERPMQFKNVMLIDNNSMRTEMLVFKPWIDHGIDKIMEIKTNNILTINKPSEKIVLCYDMEKQKEDNPQTKEESSEMHDVTEMLMNQRQPSNPNVPPDNVNITFNVPQEMAQEIVEMMGEAKAWEEMMNEEFEDEDELPKKKAKKKKKPDNSASKPPAQKKKKDDKDFGNDWSDWSPDPKDYI